jgi:hypothetical protein
MGSSPGNIDNLPPAHPYSFRMKVDWITTSISGASSSWLYVMFLEVE